MAKKRKTKSTKSTGLAALKASIANDPELAQKVYTGKEFDSAFRVLGIKEYPLRYLLDSNGLFLGKTYMLRGKPAACKSQFAFYLGRKFMEAGGVFVLVETENKASPKSLRAQLGEWYDTDQFYFHQVDLEGANAENQAELWQEAVTGWIQRLHDAEMQDTPVWIVVDSLTGAGTSGAAKRIEETGSVEGRSTSAMVRASSNTQYLPVITKKMVDTNWALAMTNHLKDKINMSGRPEKGPTVTSGGGSAVEFQCATVLDFERDSKVKGVNAAGRFISIKAFKASFGQDERRIRVPFNMDVAKDDNGDAVLDEAGHPVRTIEWGWGEAMTHLLERFCIPSTTGQSRNESYFAEAKNAFPLTRNNGKFKSDLIEDPEGKGMDAETFGRAVMDTPGALDALMSINRCSVNFYKVEVGYNDDEVVKVAPKAVAEPAPTSEEDAEPLDPLA